MKWLLFLPLNLITQLSDLNNVDPCLIAAIVSVESNGNLSACRYESHYKWLHNPDEFAKNNQITAETEVTQQKTSWGLMQIMGAVAREWGFKKPLPELVKPINGLAYGIKYFSSLINAHGNINDAISAYNQGSPRKDTSGNYHNQKYVNKVRDKYDSLKLVVSCQDLTSLVQ